MILGSSGSGKSTLARRLGEIMKVPVIHLDQLFWNPGWVETPSEMMSERAISAASDESWIIDGGFLRTIEYRMERADSIIFIDLNRYICIYSVFKRWIKYYGKTRPDMGEGCPEKIDLPFLKWIWNYPKRNRNDTLEKIYNSGKSVYYLRSRKEVKAFIQKAEQEQR